MSLLKIVVMLLSGCAVVSAQEPLANVTIEVIDSLGLPVDHAKVVLEAGGPDGKYQIVDGEVRVPLNLYVLRVEASGFASQEHRIRILQRNFFFRVALDVADVGQGHSNRVSGRIRGELPKDQELWVRLLPLITKNYSDMDYKISRGGRFEFVGIPNGRYLLLVLGGCRDTRHYPRLLKMKEISVFWDRTTVDLTIEDSHRIEPCPDRTNVESHAQEPNR